MSFFAGCHCFTRSGKQAANEFFSIGLVFGIGLRHLSINGLSKILAVDPEAVMGNSYSFRGSTKG
jgi:hypothetical protein